MKVNVLASGATLVRDESENQVWLFGCPIGTYSELTQRNLPMPDTIFETERGVPGIKEFSNYLRFEQKSLIRESLRANVINKPHGIDYIISELDNPHKIVFTERGDVGYADLRDASLAITRNKYRANNFDDSILTLPLDYTEYHINGGGVTITDKEWSSMDNVPENLKTLDDASLTLEQANLIARIAKASGNDGNENWAIAISQFKKGHLKKDGHWVKRQKSEGITVYQDKESGKWRWAGISTATILDKQLEYMSAKAIDWALNAAKVIGPGPLRYRHIPGLDGGNVTHQIRSGGLLFESGEFFENSVGRAMRDKALNEPGWRLSLGLLFAKDDLLANTFYKRVLFRERSMTKSPVVTVTAFSITKKEVIEMNVKPLNDEQLKEVAQELEMDFDEVKALHQTAIENDFPFSTKEFEEAVKAVKDDAKAEDEDEAEVEVEVEVMDEEEEEEKAPKKAEVAKKEDAALEVDRTAVFTEIANMTAEERKELRELLEMADATIEPVEPNAEMVALKEQVTAISKQLAELTNTITAKNKATDRDLVEFLKNQPRGAVFGGKQTTTTKTEKVDNKQKALNQAAEQGAENIQADLYNFFTSKSLNR